VVINRRGRVRGTIIGAHVCLLQLVSRHKLAYNAKASSLKQAISIENK
jgi:hypothetical protein